MCRATFFFDFPTPTVVIEVEQPVHSCLATSMSGLLTPLPLKSRTEVYRSVHVGQAMVAGIANEEAAVGFIKSFPAPLPLGISAAVIEARLPAIRTSVVITPNVWAHLARCVAFICLFFVRSATFALLFLIRSGGQEALEHLLL